MMNRILGRGIIAGLLVLLLLFFLGVLFFPNVKKFRDQKFFYVRTGYTMADVDRELIKQRIIKRPSVYKLAKKIMFFTTDDDIHPGRYKINDNTSNFSIIHRIRNNKEDPVLFDLGEVRTPPQLVQMFYHNTESSKSELDRFFYGDDELQKLGVDSMSLLSTFFRDKFEAKWTDDYRHILEQMHRDYRKYWDQESRIRLRNKLGLSEKEIMVLCSIVQGEIRYDTEAGIVASVYLNRLQKGMKLQADPTVIYAIGDFSKRRVSYEDLRVNSPFNTYKYSGLPPGPIQTVRKEIVDSVLNAPNTEYIFFCADPDRLGYHSFAVTYDEHLKNAEKYQKYLDEKNIH